jgi:hypothetical protein
MCPLYTSLLLVPIVNYSGIFFLRHWWLIPPILFLKDSQVWELKRSKSHNKVLVGELAVGSFVICLHLVISQMHWPRVPPCLDGALLQFIHSRQTEHTRIKNQLLSLYYPLLCGIKSGAKNCTCLGSLLYWTFVLCACSSFGKDVWVKHTHH